MKKLTATRPEPLQPDRRRFLRQTAALGAGALIVPGLFQAAHGNPEESPYAPWSRTSKGDLTDPEYLVFCGTLAANAHNSQPWSFNILGNRIVLYAELQRNLGQADPRRRLMAMNLGCAAENIGVAAAHLGYAATIDDGDAGGFLDNGGRCGTVDLARRADTAPHPWFPAMFSRRTTRAEYEPLPIPQDRFTGSVAAQGELPGVHLAWQAGESQGQAAVRATAEAVKAFVARDGAYRDSMAWFRRTRRDWETLRDGISIFTSDAPWPVKVYVDALSTPEDLLSAEFRQGEIDAATRLSRATPLWGVVWAERDTPAAWFRAGRLIERVYLAAAAEGLAVHPLAYATESAAGAAALAASLSLPPEAVPLMLMRVGLAPPLERSVRRPLHAVLR